MSNKPRIGIGWVASINSIEVFEGNDRTMVITSLQAEAQSLLRGLWEAITKGFMSVQINTDSVKLVRAISSQHQPFEISTLILDIKVTCSKFSYCEIRKVSRQDVISGPVLAKSARLGKPLP